MITTIEELFEISESARLYRNTHSAKGYSVTANIEFKGGRKAELRGEGKDIPEALTKCLEQVNLLVAEYGLIEPQ